MKETFRVVDDFCSKVEEVRASALQSGFGKWTPNKGEVGSSIYEGMNFWGRHSLMLKALNDANVWVPYPNNMFFRVTNEETERAYIHSDREWGSRTCIAYLSKHDEYRSGTAFYRHRASGLLEMPPMAELQLLPDLKRDIVEGGEDVWEQYDFVKGAYNRALIFHAPLFHSRSPKNGIGTTADDGRMVWVCHFNTLQPGGGIV